MPRDQRLYMTFPIDFPDHPKVKPLSTAAKWAFVEMNAYSRRMGLDGVIPLKLASTTWSRKILTELVQSHAERPLVVLTQESYVIRDYEQHQLTEGDIEELREKRADAGRKGGKAKASAIASAKQMGSKLVAESESESESESELLTDMTLDTESSHLSNARAADFDSESARAKLTGITDLPALIGHLEKATGERVSPRGAIELAQAIANKSAESIRNVDAYIATVCRTSAAEVQRAYFDLDIGGLNP